MNALSPGLLSTLVGKTVDLQPLEFAMKGLGFKACCPFHDEKTASFTVRDDVGEYHCLSCGARGNALDWMTKKLGLTFHDAIAALSVSTMRTDEPPMDGRWFLAYDTTLSEFTSTRPWVIATRCDDGFHDEGGNSVEVNGWVDLPEPQPKCTGWTPPSGTIRATEITGDGWTSNGQPVEVSWRWLISVEKPDGSYDQYRDTDFAVTREEAVMRATKLQARIGLPIVIVPLDLKVVPFRPVDALQ